MVSPVPASFVALAERLADAAGPVIARHFRTRVDVDDKDDASPVTIADRQAEERMRAILEAEVPDHGILGEEYGTVRGDAEWVWVLDPVDGTRAFITGLPIFGTLIGLCHRGRPVLGIIDQPILHERWLGHAGAPSTLNGQPIATRPCASPSTPTSTRRRPACSRIAGAPAPEARATGQEPALGRIAMPTARAPRATSIWSSKPRSSPTTTRRWAR